MFFDEKDTHSQLYRSENDIELEIYCKLEGVALMDITKDIKKNFISSRIIKFIKNLFN